MTEGTPEQAESLEATWDKGSRARLTRGQSYHFEGDSLFSRLGRAVCSAHVLPRKELYESWEVARRVRRHIRGRRIVDLCAGHGLTGMLLSLLDPSSGPPLLTDRRLPDNHEPLKAALVAAWPRLAETQYLACELDDVPLLPGDLVVSVHACGGLTDRVLDRAITAGAEVAVLPCCHAENRNDDAGLTAWMPNDVAIDAVRVVKLRAAGYHVHVTSIPVEITPKNRLIVGRKNAVNPGG